MRDKTKKRNFSDIIRLLRPMEVSGDMVNPRSLILLFDIMALSLVFFASEGPIEPGNFYVFTMFVVVIYLSNKFVSLITKGDPYIFEITTLLFSIGVAMIYRLDPQSGIKQIYWYLVGVIIFFIVFFILKIFHGWEKLTVMYLIGCFMLFFITLVLGKRHMGAINWIKIAGFSFQPSEITKILFVFFLGSYRENSSFLDRFRDKKFYRYKKFFLLLTVYIFIGFFFIQRDLGTAVVFYGLFLITQFVYKDDKKIILFNLLLAILGAVAAYFLFSHIRIRVATWIDPWRYIDREGYQITQALFAIASGGFFGTGIGIGQADVIPVVTSDFIFAAICEEMGVFVGMGVIMLFLLFVYRGYKISIEQRSSFFKFVAFGITTIFAMQAIIMFGGVLKLLPLTGVTIPFVSYGGSSMVSSFMCLAILEYCSTDLDVDAEVL